MGDCIKGRAAIQAHFKDRFVKLGHAASASVISAGAVQQGGFVYEWGRAEASFAAGAKVEGHYLTVWQKQPDGSWRIFRNMAIPADGAR
jgi:ketosteroid isomerase-like protein